MARSSTILVLVNVTSYLRLVHAVVWHGKKLDDPCSSERNVILTPRTHCRLAWQEAQRCWRLEVHAWVSHSARCFRRFCSLQAKGFKGYDVQINSRLSEIFCQYIICIAPFFHTRLYTIYCYLGIREITLSYCSSIWGQVGCSRKKRRFSDDVTIINVSFFSEKKNCYFIWKILMLL